MKAGPKGAATARCCLSGRARRMLLGRVWGSRRRGGLPTVRKGHPCPLAADLDEVVRRLAGTGLQRAAAALNVEEPTKHAQQ